MEKSFQWLLLWQIRKRIKKLKPSILEIVGGYTVWKIPENHCSLWIKSFLCIFRKNCWGENLFVFKCYTTCQSLGRLLHKEKNNKKMSRNRVDPLKHSDMLLLTLELKMAEFSVFQCLRRTSISVYWKNMTDKWTNGFNRLFL